MGLLRNDSPPAHLGFHDAKASVGVLSVSAALAAAGGFLDGFTYVGHGQVFANAMTGNVVLLGISSVLGQATSRFRHLPPIIAFLLGTGVAQAIQLLPKRRQKAPPYLTVLLAEAAVLMIISFLPRTTSDLVITTLVAFTAAVQVSTFREVNGHTYNSTFTTGNLRTLSEAASSWLLEGHAPGAVRVVRDFSVICISFLLGATVGGYTTRAFGNRALWITTALFLLIALLVFKNEHLRQARPASED